METTVISRRNHNDLGPNRDDGDLAPCRMRANGSVRRGSALHGAVPQLWRTRIMEHDSFFGGGLLRELMTLLGEDSQ
jgi:hypothetical protein